MEYKPFQELLGSLNQAARIARGEIVDGVRMMTIGQRIKKSRTEAGLTIDQLAERIGMTRESVRGWETGIAEPRSKVHADLARHLNVSELYLVAGIAADKTTDALDGRVQLFAETIMSLSDKQFELVLSVAKEFTEKG